ncbi:2-oxoacid dehydrogenase acyltransferase [Aphelenchoides avenae]|nr:2-oxoacid dehydrogenase acyltransferase [Aphelenchus avenae]
MNFLIRSTLRAGLVTRSHWCTRPLCRRHIHLTGSLDKLVHFKLSDIGEGIAEVQLKEWHVKEGDRVNEFDNLCEVQSDKASVTITSRYEGIVKKLHFKVDDMAKVGSTLVDIDIPDSAEADSSLAEQDDRKPHPDNAQRLLATPAVRRLIKENKIDLERILGTGKEGRVLKEDVLRHIGVLAERTVDSGAYSPSTASTRPREQLVPGKDTVVPIRGYTRAMIKSMSEALKIPHFGYKDEFVADALVDMRRHLAAEGKKRGIKVTYMPIIIKATSLALLQYPILNSSMDEKMENIIYKANHNISLAIDTPGGLVVPNIKNCEQKNIWQIAADLNRLQDAGERQQISRSDLTGGTFSLSNIGIIGGTYADPVVFPPQVAIGAIGRIRKLPRFAEDGITVRPVHVINFSWAADHRVVDGATMARFSNVLKEYIENPAKMIAELC